MAEKLRILAIDDEPNVTKMIKRLLVVAGYDVVELNEPLKLEEFILYTEFSLVITDLKMPGRDGLEVLRLVKESKPELPVVMLTGISTIETAVEATKLGAAEYLTKPIDKETLSAAVKKHANMDQALPAGVKALMEGASFQEIVDEAIEPEKILLSDEILSTETIPDGLVEVKFSNIVPGQFLPFAIYIQIYNRKSKRHLLRKICQENTVFTSGMHQILEKKNLGSVFIREHDYDAYLEYHQAMRSATSLRHTQIRDKKKLVLYGKAVEAITDILSDPVENQHIQSALDLVDNFLKTIVDDPITYQDMYKLFKRDTNIFNHSANVCLLSVSFGVYLGLDEKVINILGFGALFHDVGMNRVDRRILEKTTSLTPAEWQEIHKHPERGLALLKASRLVPVPALRIVLEHHEQADGSGYPRGLRANQISNLARLCSIVDKFDSMTTNQPYREAFSAAEALKRIFVEEPTEKYQAVIRKFIAFLGGNK